MSKIYTKNVLLQNTLRGTKFYIYHQKSRHKQKGLSTLNMRIVFIYDLLTLGSFKQFLTFKLKKNSDNCSN